MKPWNTSPTAVRLYVIIGLLVLAVAGGAAPAVACGCALTAAPAEFDKPTEEPGAPEAPPIDDVDFRIAPIPEEELFPDPLPVVTTPPKLAAESFGIGWTSAAAVGVALLAVLAMALVWRREEA